MAKRSKELFELLREQREAAEAVRRAAAERQTEQRKTADQQTDYREQGATDRLERFDELDDVDDMPATPTRTFDDHDVARYEKETETAQPARRDRRRDEIVYADEPLEADDTHLVDDDHDDAAMDHAARDVVHEDPREAGVEQTPEAESLGNRRVSLSLNFVLFFVAAFLLTNVMSYLVGSMNRAAEQREATLSVKLNKLWAVQVTPLLDLGRERSFAWELRDLLIGEGFSGAEVHLTKLNNRSYLRTIASKHTDKRRCVEDARRLDGAVSRLMRAGKLNADKHPIEISVIPIQETEKASSRKHHVDP